MKKTGMKKTVRKKETKKLLGQGEPKPFSVVNAQGRGAGVIVCDHASNKIPRALQKTLGVSRKDVKRHIGWDIGAKDISLYLARALDMPAVIAQYSRLVVDLNRDPDYHECMPTQSDHVPVPGNRGLTKAEKNKRLSELFWPYQEAVGKTVDGYVRRRKQAPLILFVHTMTNVMDGKKRPHLAILWNKEEKIARAVMAAFRKNYPRYTLGANTPYSLKDERFKGSTAWRHAEMRGIPYVFVEFRQDLVDTKKKAEDWGRIFLHILTDVLADDKIRRRKVKKPV